LKLNLGCGHHYVDGYTNVDVQVSPHVERAPDLLADVRAVPLPDRCASEVMALHVIEHFYRWEVLALLQEWRRLLVSGGLLVLELPNIELAARNLLKGRGENLSMWALYGDPAHEDPFMCHRWGYTPGTLSALLLEAGFTRIEHMAPRTHSKRADRDMRLEARKP
jgi:SAM-dependent methyltransferase